MDEELNFCIKITWPYFGACIIKIKTDCLNLLPEKISRRSFQMALAIYNIRDIIISIDSIVNHI